MVGHVTKLTEQKQKHHFNKKSTEIQIDCDWCATTKDAYFKFLILLSKKEIPKQPYDCIKLNI